MKINIANIIALVLSAFVLVIIISFVLCDHATELNCKVFTAITQVPCWSALIVIFANELISEIRG